MGRGLIGHDGEYQAVRAEGGLEKSTVAQSLQGDLRDGAR